MGAEGVSLPRVLFIQQLSPSGVVSESRTEMLRINSLNKNGQPAVLLQGIAVFDPPGHHVTLPYSLAPQQHAYLV